jgi:pseudouridine synthase
VGSRRRCEEVIAAGRVAVDGRVVTELGTKADPSRQRITVDGRPVRAEPLAYYVLNKPRGTVSTTAEDARRTRVTDLVPPRPRVFPVGRLDVESEGLVLLTNDGELTHRMTHPRWGLKRVYRVEVRGDASEKALAKLRKGVHLAEGRTLPPEVKVLRRGEGAATLEVAIREGLNREVRRMLAAVGLKARRLVRTRLGPVALAGLPSGSWRELGAAELGRLRGAVSGEGAPPPGWLRRRRPKRRKGFAARTPRPPGKAGNRADGASGKP